jgi:ceramide glucosyltransferase
MHLLQVLRTVAALGTVASAGYYLLCLWSALAFGKARRQAGREALSAFTPPVSILKPLKGTDPEIYQSFRSHCLQDYPEYEIIFGVSDADDPAIAEVVRLQQEFPEHVIRLVDCTESLGTNTKVSNLAQMSRQASHAYFVVNDSDIRVENNYLRRVIAGLNDDSVGMITCLYRGVASATLGSRLESLGISTDFSPGVLTARQIEKGIRFGLGSTLAFRRADLEAMGGFESIVDYLADDYELGKRIADRGLKVKLSDVVVETFLPPYSLGAFVRHQLRWARSVRDSRRWGYVGLVLTFGLVWALLTLLLAGAVTWAWGLFAATVSLRVAVAVFVGQVTLQDRQVMWLLPLIPLRDLLAFAVWLISFTGHTVDWRGSSFLLKDGKLARLQP